MLAKKKKTEMPEADQRTLIQSHLSNVVKGFCNEADTLEDMDHNLTKGELREMIISKIFRKFLTAQFEIGSGIIINCAGIQSKQMDIVIYDNRILPPFIREAFLGVYPAESVVATIEVKTKLNRTELDKAEESAKRMHLDVFDHKSYKGLNNSYKYPLCALFAYHGSLGSCQREESGQKKFLSDEIKCIKAICILKKFSWMWVSGEWRFDPGDPLKFRETKRFIAVLLDNIRTIGEHKYRSLVGHRDWMGAYIREQSKQ